jgi:uncharacterized RDD family membrane protein YckC
MKMNTTPASSRSSLTPSPSAPNFPATAPAPPPAAQSEAQQIVSGAALAGMGDRAIAAVLDSVVIAFLMVPVGMWAAAHWGGITPSGFELRGIAAFFTFSSVGILWLVYYWLLEGVSGATLGKLVMNVRVRRFDGSNIDLRRSLIRNLLRVIDAIGVYLVGFLVALLSGKRQRLGDHVADTVVVQASAGKVARVAATLAWVAVIASCFIAAYKLHAGGPQSETARPGAPLSQATPRGAKLGTQANPAQAGPRLTRAEIGTDSTENFQIIGASSEFYPDTPQIVCVWNIEGIDPGTLIKSVWIAEDVGEGTPSNYQIAEKSITGLNEGKFFMTIPTNGWPIGKYRLEIYIGDNLAKQLPFTVKQR